MGAMRRTGWATSVSLLLASLSASWMQGAEPLRLLPCPTTGASDVNQWQRTARTTLFALMAIDDLVAANSHDRQGRGAMALHPKVIATRQLSGSRRYDMTIASRPDRSIPVVLTIPDGAGEGTTPAVICLHGHGGNRNIVYDAQSIYHGFATELAQRGFVTVSTDVGQHDVQDSTRTLMGERLWDCMRLVDLVESRQEVDPRRIGCAGLSLGGEMAMWLGAMDTRIQATISCGFLTTMENLRDGHCMCWDFPGLQRRYEFVDIYGLIAPRALQCQNGRLERLPGGFPVDLARPAMDQIRQVYETLGARESAALFVHDSGHVFDVDGALPFLKNALGSR